MNMPCNIRIACKDACICFKYIYIYIYAHIHTHTYICKKDKMNPEPNKQTKRFHYVLNNNNSLKSLP